MPAACALTRFRQAPGSAVQLGITPENAFFVEGDAPLTGQVGSHARMLRFADRLAGCRVVASVVPQHLYGLTFRIFLPMSLGLPLHAAMLYYAEQLAALPHDHRYIFISSPAFLKRLDTQLSPPPVAMLLSAGGMLPCVAMRCSARAKYPA